MSDRTRILVIDDNADDRELASRALRREFPDVEVSQVNDADGLDAALAAGGFDLVVTDYELRWTDGLAVLRRVVERHPDVPVVMFTNTGTEEVAVAGMKAGLADYVIKRPREYDRLAFAARNAMSLARTRRELDRRQAEVREHERQLAALLQSEKLARLEAEQANRLKDEFLATVSHELRTPLNAILGWSQLLRSRMVPSGKIDEAHEIIERNARIQARLVEDLLDLSRIVSGQVRLEVQAVDLVAVLRSAVQAVQPSADAKGIAIRQAIDPVAGPVRGDPARLQQVLWNLLTNAVKFTNSGGWIQLRVERVNSHVEVTVADNGIGIDPHFVPKLFERFRQADGSTTRRHGGLGIGLAIVKHLTELHGGRVGAHSDGPGTGSTFKVCLPVAAVAGDAGQADRPHPASGEGPAVAMNVSLDGVTILTVDDDVDACGLIGRILGNVGAAVLCAHSADEGLNLLRRHRPDVLLSDIGMPGEDGYAFIARVRDLGPAAGGAVPAAALTAFARSEDRQRALLAGFQSHIAKPVEPNELLAVVASLAGRTGRGSGA